MQGSQGIREKNGGQRGAKKKKIGKSEKIVSPTWREGNRRKKYAEKKGGRGSDREAI